MFYRVTSLIVLIASAFCLTGCLLETETAISPDKKVDPRLERVWQITKKSPDEVRSDRDEDDVGVYGYIIIAPLKNPDGTIGDETYKALAFDSFERASPSKSPEMLLSTRRYNDHDFILIHLPDYEKEKTGKDGKPFKNWVLDYEFNKRGELFLRFWFIDDFDELQKAHPIKFDASKEPFAPVTLKGNERELLDFYADPKVRSFLTALGKYQKLQPPKR